VSQTFVHWKFTSKKHYKFSPTKDPMQPMQHKHICFLPLVFKCGVQTTAKAAKAAKSQQLAANFGMLT
jgi:hypothetical protein